jgi:hypothetical protein
MPSPFQVLHGPGLLIVIVNVTDLASFCLSRASRDLVVGHIKRKWAGSVRSVCSVRPGVRNRRSWAPTSDQQPGSRAHSPDEARVVKVWRCRGSGRRLSAIATAAAEAWSRRKYAHNLARCRYKLLSLSDLHRPPPVRPSRRRPRRHGSGDGPILSLSA